MRSRTLVAALTAAGLVLTATRAAATPVAAVAVPCHSEFGFTGQPTWGYGGVPNDGARDYVAFRLAQAGATDPGDLGPADVWATSARADGFTVDSVPHVGAVAAWTGTGRLAIVDWVDPAGSTIFVTEISYGSDPAHPVQTCDGVQLTHRSLWPSAFLHLHDVTHTRRVVNDFDGDGRSDLFNAGMLIPSAGPVSAQPYRSTAAAAGAAWVTSGDVDGDGKSDLLFQRPDSDTVQVDTAVAAGGTASVWATGMIRPAWEVSADVDGDGRADLIYQDYGSTDVMVRHSAGSTAGPASVFASGIAVPTWRVGGDFTGDGKADLLLQEPGSSDVTLLTSTGTGSVASIWATHFDRPVWELAGDFDGDGTSELAYQDRNGLVRVRSNHGGATSDQDVGGNVIWRHPVVGDFDGDGQDEILREPYPAPVVMLLDRVGPTTRGENQWLSGFGFGQAPVDLDGDRTVAGTYQPVGPSRVLDTRSGLGGTRAQVPAGGSVAVQIDNQSFYENQVYSGVARGVAGAAALTVTAVTPASSGHLTVYADGDPTPTASNVNFVTGHTVANQVMVKVGADGKVRVANGSAHAVDVVVDLSGYTTWGVPDAPGTFQSVPPTRLLDTRGDPAAVPAGGTVTVPVAGAHGLPASGVGEAVVNLTATQPSAAGNITAYAGGSSPGAVSNVNFVAGQTVPNLAVVAVGADGTIRLVNHSPGSVHLIVDILGYYRAGTTDVVGAFVPVTPTRVMNTRIGLLGTTLAAGGFADALLVPGVSARSGPMVINLTVTNARGTGYLAEVGSESSLLNFRPGDTVAGLATLPYLYLKNGSNGTLDLIADLSGYYLGLGYFG